MTTSCEIAVVGAGPVGGTLALALAARGRKVLLVDKADLKPMEHPDFDGRAYAIAHGCKDILREAGLWERLPFAPCPILDIDVTDGKPGRAPSPLKLHFDHRAVGDDPFGWIIEARSVRVALNAALADSDVIVRAPAEAVVTRNADGAVLQVGDERFESKLVVAAEGRQSPLRNQAGISVTRLPYHQTGVIFAIAHEKPHNSVALEHFLPGGPFAVLPMTGTAAAPNLSALVFTESDANAKLLYGMDDAALARQVAARLGNRLGSFTLAGRRWLYPLYAMYASRYYDTRLALAGDSAHGVHPIAGQGLNLGLRDAAALLDLASKAEDPGADSVLRAYQARQRPVNMAMLLGMDALDRLFSTNFPPVRLARDLGLAAVERMPRLKQRFMLAAMGR
ncbi:UbiH/UbiF/VisC/COQ6 family ubiquinone biosynthesis hydroxylase [Acidocella aminolytica]|uniref:Hydroxylase/monooxygenase, ubiquinone biosynthesis hydroxylase n=1 Tax=Acidocella aminolytica 101 = DSM 11237 TaxID=1120923 RepID=A0A0D6PGA5_9PROT|nr:UbiH/UbiF/VisC/COQ6 family ubiquinone biosynthesis hydroxylase [Acidocella aminolytica]GAN80805.1 hydroxylase/monooxygenase, ubiquinone biosynthesis hydroxylase [Acidocella aminolytica 101 = DSM 11237]GBQ36389.1 ubiquinone biosynthesis hydroxylase UbiH/UbiF/VisC/COQ6 [Acidocella aminolytica 101 = DSM 11237]SHE33026.1 2-octaprenyl-6-methoxyphenol hydroxylase [Acidocella aminolytica 101 = DSM 11237]